MKPEPRADLRTAQNRIFPFVATALTEQRSRIEQLALDKPETRVLYLKVRAKLHELMGLSEQKPDVQPYHFAITDSGKRTIELLVQMLCPAEPNLTSIIPTENYVAFNAFSVARTLVNRKKVKPVPAVRLAMGEAVTGGSSGVMEELEQFLIRHQPAILWFAANSTSTGVKEDVHGIVRLRNRCAPRTLILCDCASLPLVTDEWPDATELPDGFFFSLRKQGLPYEGPQDEANQAKNSGGLLLFNDRVLEQASQLEASPLYPHAGLHRSAMGQLGDGDQEQKRKHIHHLVKLEIMLDHFLTGDRERLKTQDALRKEVQQAVFKTFSGNSILSGRGYSLLADPQYQSTTSYTVKTPQTVSPKRLITNLKESGILVSPSMHPLLPADDYFRFAFYPANSREEIELFLDALSSGDLER